MHSQQGSSVLLMVIIILLMGSALLHATRQQLSDRLSLVSDEHQYIRQYNLAASALAWGERLNWAEDAESRCQSQPVYGWRACLLTLPAGMLLRGDSGRHTLAQYRWVRWLSGSKLRAVPHGWLDYCPLADRHLCDEY